MYAELTELQEIQSAQKGLSAQLNKEFTFKKHRTIG